MRHKREKAPRTTSFRRILISRHSSSFEPPTPPTSNGYSVYPDIVFESSTEGNEDGVESTRRNSDPDAVFVVNGSSRGIGLQFVKSLIERTQGRIVACCRSPEESTQLNDIASQHPGRVHIISLDVERQPSIDQAAETIAKTYKRVDVLFNVAGILGDGGVTTPGPERSVSKIERSWMEKSMAVNFVGPVMLSKALSPMMRTKTGGKRKITVGETSVELANHPRAPTVIANLSARVGSISDNQMGGWYSYRASKAALNQATRTMAHELKRQGTFTVALHPGTTDTGLSKPFQKNVQEGRLFPVEFTAEQLLDVVDAMSQENSGGLYDWAGKALPF